MIDREELRRLMEMEGYDPETIDGFLAWYYGTSVDTDTLTAALDLLRAEIAKAVPSMAKLWEQLVRAVLTPPRPALPRPPRNTCPKNWGARTMRRPARVARSNCRKIHR